MAAVLLPPTFHNSFWSNQDYFRTGLEVLMRKLQEGCDENVEIGVFIKAQAQHYRQLARSIANDTPPLPHLSSSSSNDTPSTLQTTLATIQSSSVTAQADHYARLADDLEFRVARDFERWSAAHRNRVMMASEEALGHGVIGKGRKDGDSGLVGRYETMGLQVAKLKQNYLSKARLADDMEEDARFAPHFSPQAAPTPQKSTTANPSNTKNLTPILPSSPRLTSLKERTRTSASNGPSETTSGLRRTGTVADRINEKLRAASTLRRTPGTGGGSSISSLKGIGESVLSLADSKAIDTPTSGLPPISRTNDGHAGPASSGDYILLAGLSMPIIKLFEFLAQLQHYLATSLPSPGVNTSEQIKGDSTSTTQKTSTEGSENEKTGLLAAGTASVDPNRDGDGALRSRTRMTMLGSYDSCVSGAELQKWLLEHIEGLGNDPSRGSEAGAALVKWGLIGRINVGRGWQDDEETFYYMKDAAFDTSPFAIESLKNHIRASEPASKASSAAAENFTPPAPSVPTLPSLSTASTLVKSYLPALSSLPGGLGSVMESGGDAPHVKARREAKIADDEYRSGVNELEVMRLRVEEWIEKALKSWERWERERIGSVKTVLGQYQSVISTLPGRMQSWTSEIKIAIEAFKPDVDFRALIENNRIGNFRPTPHIYESLDSDEPEVSFGIDLRKWAGSNWKAILRDSSNEKTNGAGKGNVPPAFVALLKGLEMKYSEVPDELQRKSWIFLVDLRETHELRERINDPHVPLADMLDEVAKFNAPVIAATIKLWLLELNPPVCGYDAYEACKALYARRNDTQSNERLTSAISDIMSRLSGVQILILDTLFAHLQALVQKTRTEEADEVFITKLALSLGRAILRPATESAVTLQDRTPSRLFTDLYTYRHEIFAPLVERAQQAIDRPMPVRKRTRPVDQRISRTRLSESGEDGVKLYRDLQGSSVTPEAAGELLQTPGKGQEQVQDRTKDAVPHGVSEREKQQIEAPQSDAENVSPTDDVLEGYTDARSDDETTPTAANPASPPFINTTDSAAAAAPPPAIVSQTEPERPTTPPPRRKTPVADEDAPLTPVARTAGARLSRSSGRMSLHREKTAELAGAGTGVVADSAAAGEVSLKRAGSGEARTIRGPRGLLTLTAEREASEPFADHFVLFPPTGARGPRPGPGKMGSVDLSASPNVAGRPGSPSIKDRIAHLESRGGGGGAGASGGPDRFV
ncbi:hypothetical protein QFC22_001257 [Naganishia vaughanmartiniae]|uniref:Uncharacterized protein n=1 Tax=Naganishia vaughanmartiniae TaxID=1424756 RepID=A0ACC2XGC2_9TREE|nr:hypothetical protein QFC22_001257 [Naganishia vaughanmartiniae]